jgi:hypothetical protein
MGFECALALCVPEEKTLYDYEQGDPDDPKNVSQFFDGRTKVAVPTRTWRVFKFIDFGRVRAVVKRNSSLSPAQRAEGKFDERAAICAASFLVEKFFGCERKVREGEHSFAVPFIADHYLEARVHLDDHVGQYSFRRAYAETGVNEVVVGLHQMREFKQTPTHDDVFSGALWEYNKILLSAGRAFAVTMDDNIYQSACGLVWAPASEVLSWFIELLTGDSTESVELRKDPLAVNLVQSWCLQETLFAELGARVIILTGYFHSDARSAIRSQRMYV